MDRILPKLILVSVLLTILIISSASQQPVPKKVMERGKEVYVLNCLVCHQEDGGGVPRMNPPLSKTDWVVGDKKKLINVILYGLDEELEINGESYHNPMPAMTHLTDQQIADVLSYTRNSFGNKASIVTPAEVAAQRKKR